ncbi:uncharacterized protein LOC127580817 isoform X2 [Pristis pectinata]|nr:uncharacterized protein LOC127580817 isoform X2 [Pristis pectinata]
MDATKASNTNTTGAYPEDTNSTYKPDTAIKETKPSVPNNFPEESSTAPKIIQNGDGRIVSEGTQANSDTIPATDSFNRVKEKYKMQGEEPQSDHPVVFTTLLVTGLLAATGILAGSYYSYKKKKTAPCTRLAEEADALDHDSVMFSGASEDQSDAHDKPKVNGEAQEKGENTKPATGGATGESQVKKGKEEGDTEL